MGAFNQLYDRWRFRLTSFAGDEFRTHLQRVGVSYKDIKLTSTQMDSLNGTPVELIPAPGAGKAIEVLGAFSYIDAGSTPFELGSGTLLFKYTNGSGAEVATAIPNATVESATDTYYRSVALAVVPVVNAAIVAHAGADVTAGNGAVYIRVYYRTVTIETINPALS